MKKSIRNNVLRILPLAILSFGTMSCSDTEDSLAPSKGDGKSRSIEINDAEREASAQSNRFAWDFLDKCMAQEKGNVALSPVSANICLSMLANAAAGNSRAQILEAMGFADGDMANVNSLNHKLAQQICDLDDNVTLTMANSFWYNPDISPKSAFITDLRDNYDIQTYEINPATFAKDVNRWCNDRTKGLIPRILDDDAYEEFAFLNAIYFKGYWNDKFCFSKKDTKKGKFNNSDGSKTDVNYMHKKFTYEYTGNEQWRAARIPFGGSGFNYTVILPNDGYSVDDCMESIHNVEPATMRFSSAGLDLKMPKFKMDHEQDLIPVLMEMGIRDIFTDPGADFSNMTDYNSMYIDLAKQNVSFEVNEEGAEAAAVTVIGGALTSVDPVVVEYMPFNVDRPFIFMISERSTGAIIFMGRINQF